MSRFKQNTSCNYCEKKVDKACIWKQQLYNLKKVVLLGFVYVKKGT